MNTPQNNETFSDEMGNIFKKTSNLTKLITMTQKQNNILLDQTIETPEEWAKNEIEKKIHHEEKTQKEQFLEKYFGMDVEATQNRPDIKNIDLNDENAIFRFIALQNLACAFSCCIDTTTPYRIEEIGKIFQGKNDGKFVHFTIYPSPKWEAIKLQNPKEALAYFEVYLKDSPQNDAEKSEIMSQFHALSHTVKNQNDHQ
jgi:hypothetical protein